MTLANKRTPKPLVVESAPEPITPEKPQGTLLTESDSDPAFLANVGQRVRELRAQRGMARKALSREAHVSERYLAQLETGTGNASIALLRRIALALGVQLSDLLEATEAGKVSRLIRRFLEIIPNERLQEVLDRLTEEFGQDDAVRRKRIALIGLRGAGKTTLGKMLGKTLRRPFIELDQEIEREAGMSLSEVFLLYGQAEYHRIERRCLERVIRSEDTVVLAAGGSIVSESETYGLLLRHCFTVWVKASPEEHMFRVVAQGDSRPMAGRAEAMNELRRILSEREPLYRKADAVIDTAGTTLADSMRNLELLTRVQ